jgi:hypothetical protein
MQQRGMAKPAWLNCFKILDFNHDRIGMIAMLADRRALPE